MLTVILKGLDPFISEDKFEKAGRAAEEQLAFYLRRAFVDDKDILVFNNLRFENNHDVAQIDHLILHKYGMIIIESKSVTTKVEINECEEWIRWFDNTAKGMPSPIQQAKRQGEFLRKYLNQNASTLLGKLFFGVMGPQASFRAMPLDIIVAISDSGIVERPKSVSLPEVCKADQVSDRVRLIFDRWHKTSGVLSLDLSGGYIFTKDEIANISKFLIAKNKPLAHQASPQKIPVAEPSFKSWNSKGDVSEPSKHKDKSSYSQPSVIKKQTGKDIQVKPVQVCAYCKSVNLRIEYGYNYYFKCLDCEKNTTIKSICKSCGGKEKTRKSGLQFYSECSHCQTSKLFYTNPTTT
ncbi:MAG: nuclease-related domain-containing protein [Gloeobacterales cyanobacterium]